MPSLDVFPPLGRADLGRSPSEPFAPRDRTVILPDVGSIHGTVVDDEGRPVQSGQVLYRRDGAWSPVMTDWRARFSWSAYLPASTNSPPSRTRRTRRARARRSCARRPETQSVVVPLSTGATLDVTMDGAVANDLNVFDDLASFWLRPETSEDRGGTRFEFGQASARFVGLLAGARYALTVRAGERVGVATGLVPRAEPYVVPLEKGLSITGRITAPVAAYVQRVVATGPAPGMDVLATTDGDRYSLVGLLPGAWTITVEARDEECRLWRGTATAAAGGTADVALSAGGR